MASQRFMIEDDPIALPRGAWAATERRTLRLDDRPVFSLTQGRYRAYLYPLLHACRLSGGQRGTGRPPAS